jgi:hypothetical protein
MESVGNGFAVPIASMAPILVDVDVGMSFLTTKGDLSNRS